MATIYDEMRRQRVYIQKGKFSTDKMEGRLLQAPFDVVVIPGLSNEQFLQPRTQVNPLTAITLNLSTFKDEQDEAIYIDGEGYTTLDPIVLGGEYEMGGWQSDAHAWKDVHRFSWF